MNNDLLKGLTGEQRKKLETCKSSEEILALAKAEGVELNDEQLQAISGGSFCHGPKIKCPRCESRDVEFFEDDTKPMRYWAKCNACGHVGGQARFC